VLCDLLRAVTLLGSLLAFLRITAICPIELVGRPSVSELRANLHPAQRVRCLPYQPHDEGCQNAGMPNPIEPTEPANRVSFVDSFAMAHLQHQDHQLFLLNLDNDPEISHAQSEVG